MNRRIFICAAFFGLSVLPSQQIDDFSLSQKGVEQIFSERLDLFPRVKTAELARHFFGLCRQYRFDPALVLSLIQVESAFRVSVVSPAGAIGLMQLMPATAEHVARQYGIRYTGERSLTDPFTNLTIGMAYLWILRERYRDFSPYHHLAAYNIGPAKLDELLSRNTFTPVKTKKYYEDILREAVRLRSFQDQKA